MSQAQDDVHPLLARHGVSSETPQWLRDEIDAQKPDAAEGVRSCPSVAHADVANRMVKLVTERVAALEGHGSDGLARRMIRMGLEKVKEEQLERPSRAPSTVGDEDMPKRSYRTSFRSEQSRLERWKRQIAMTKTYKTLPTEACKDAYMAMKTSDWAKTVAQKRRDIIHSQTVTQSRPRPRVGTMSKEELDEEFEQRHDESPAALLKRLAGLLDEQVEYNSMLDVEGEDCWDDESFDSEKERFEEKLEEYADKPSKRNGQSEVAYEKYARHVSNIAAPRINIAAFCDLFVSHKFAVQSRCTRPMSAHLPTQSSAREQKSAYGSAKQ